MGTDEKSTSALANLSSLRHGPLDPGTKGTA